MRYRITKRFVSLEGRIYQQQEVLEEECLKLDSYGRVYPSSRYVIQDIHDRSHVIEPSDLIENGADYIKETCEVEEIEESKKIEEIRWDDDLNSIDNATRAFLKLNEVIRRFNKLIGEKKHGR